MNNKIQVGEHNWKDRLWVYLILFVAFLFFTGGFFAIMHFIFEQPVYY